MSSTTNLQTGDGWTHLQNLETLQNLQVDGNLTVLGTINGSEDNMVVITAITTVGNGTLTAAGLVGNVILRTGPTTNFSDATDTAAAIYAALGSPAANTTSYAIIKNATAFTQTITAGVGVTLPATVIVPAYTEATYLMTVNSATAVTFAHIGTNEISVGTSSTASAITAISTIGAGTITAASINGGLIQRSGSQSGTAFTDTTDTAAAIIAACANLVAKIGTSMLIEYSNTTNATATITGGTGVTVSGVSVIPANSIAQFLLTYTAAATMTMVGLGVTQGIATAVTILGSSTGSTAVASANAGATNYTATLPANTGTVAELNLAQTWTAAQTFTNSDIILLGSSTGATTFTSANAGASNFTVTVPAATGTMSLNGAPIAVGSSLAVTAAMNNQAILLNTAGGSTATLPAATGSGAVFKFIVSVSTTSAAHKILANSVSDFIIGRATGSNAAGAALQFSSPAATNHSIQMPNAGSQPSGGIIGDSYTFTDIGANLWECVGVYEAGTTATTPFSSATS